ncbi:AraC family transcriptional regulator [Paenibacillus sp. CCS19]|uniref:AraC family transcriptional regulator n=1 Tax=Paenibacillus sp. CCS19 TaxID=3158387 RepID=UPI00256A1088|nr:AraC family transcriptional regulator [Paenibacillus cellulosilyticus]GMK42382.1 AraC family transcriptional regulator [Paenibacillus cellulosilyticus]
MCAASDSKVKIARDDMGLPAAFPFESEETFGVVPMFQRLHWHDGLEINCIKQGRGHYIINGRTYPFETGDILLIGSNDLHCAYESPTTEGLLLQVISFDRSLFAGDHRYDPDLLQAFRLMGSRYDNLLGRNHPKAALLQQLCADMHTEYTEQTSHYPTMIRSYLLRFLIEINRHCAVKQQAGPPPLQRHHEMIQIAVRMMEERLAETWTLASIAAQVQFSPSYFSAIFKELVGMAPMEYLIQLRLARAVELLNSTDRKIIDIALACGFHNLSNFNRLFMKHIGQSPKDIRITPFE